MKTSEVLDRAADMIQERGWTYGPSGWEGHGDPEQTGLCLEGGIAAAVGISLDSEADQHALVSCPAYEAVWNYLETDTTWECFHDRLYDWNDTADRSAEDVIAVLRATALIEAAKENSEVSA